MGSLKALIACFLFFILFTFKFSFAQDPPIEWEEIPMEDLKMKVCPADSGASAYILCDFGFTDFDDNLDLVFTRHQRIKLFNENGYSLASFTIPIYNEAEHLDNVEGVTYYLDDNGEMVSAELDDDDIKEEEVSDNLKNYKFTMPSLKQGCIIEVRYTVFIRNIQSVPDWIFQYSEPVRWSEYRVISLSNIAYSAVTRGYENFYINETINTTKFISGQASSYTGKTIAECNIMRWVVKDAPAVREEPFITCTDDYKNNVQIQLSGYAVSGGVKSFLNDWPTFVKEMLDSRYVGKMISSSGDIEDLSAKITKNILVPLDKIKAIHHWVANSIVWSGRNSIYCDKEPDEIIELKKGNNAEINILLLSLLRSAGIECSPLIMSTRGNGRIQELYPIYSQFNYLIVRAKAGGKYLYLDATDPLRPYDLLPSKIANVKAVVLSEGPVQWDVLKVDKPNLVNSMSRMIINEDGSLSGYTETTFGEYRSVQLRDKLSEKNITEIAKEEFETDKYSFVVDSVHILNKDSVDTPLKMNVKLSSTQYSQVNGDKIYINPHLFYKMDENPLKSEKRKFPVDYGYKRGSSFLIDLTIPDNYEITEKLANRFFVAGSSNIQYNRKVVMDGNHIQILCRFDIKETEVKPSEYKELREFYSRVLEAESEQIVLSRKTHI